MTPTRALPRPLLLLSLIQLRRDFLGEAGYRIDHTGRLRAASRVRRWNRSEEGSPFRIEQSTKDQRDSEGRAGLCPWLMYPTYKLSLLPALNYGTVPAMVCWALQPVA